jgi:hypothetical protein
MRFLTGSAHARLVREMDLLFGPSFSNFLFPFFILFLSLKCIMRNESICQDRLGTYIVLARKAQDKTMIVRFAHHRGYVRLKDFVSPGTLAVLQEEFRKEQAAVLQVRKRSYFRVSC